MLCLAMVVDYYSSVLAYDNTPLSFANFVSLQFPWNFIQLYFPFKAWKKMSCIGGEMIWRDEQRDNCHWPWPNGLCSIKIWSLAKRWGFLKSWWFLSKTIIIRFSFPKVLVCCWTGKESAPYAGSNYVPSVLTIQKTDGSLLGPGSLVGSLYVRTAANESSIIGMCLLRGLHVGFDNYNTIYGL
jgi:hypothetical protein